MIIQQNRVKIGNPGKIVYSGTIKQALNGYIVIIEEDEQMVDSSSLPDIQDQMEHIMKAVHNVNGFPGGDNEIQRIIRENNKKPSKDEIPKIKKVGVRVFSTFKEAAAFLSFIFEEDDLEEMPIKSASKDNNKSIGTSLDDFTK